MSAHRLDEPGSVYFAIGYACADERTGFVMHAYPEEVEKTRAEMRAAIISEHDGHEEALAAAHAWVTQ